MFDFYDLIDTYATLNHLDRAEALHLWYRGNITAEDLLNPYLETDTLVKIIKIIKLLNHQSKRDGHDAPWEA